MDWCSIEKEMTELPLLAAMVSARVRAQRKAVPVLPERYVSAAQVLPQLENLCRHGDVLVARDGGRPIGFLGGWIMERFMGDRDGVYIPEYGFGTNSLDPVHVCRVFEQLYAVQCDRWCRAGALNHAIITYDEERVFRDDLFRGGFGGACIDAIRPALALRLPIPSDVRIREVKAGDPFAMKSWIKLCNLHHDYMRAAPVLLGSSEEMGEPYFLEWIGQDDHHAWIAESEAGEPLAYLQLEQKTEGTSMLVDDPGNMAITGAFTLPETRGRGLATLLLDKALACAAVRGRTSVSVDFESRNRPAERFWTRHFTPFTFSVLRQVDARAL